MLAATVEEQRRIIGERTLTLRRRRGIRSARRLSAALGWGANRVGQVERFEVDLDLMELYTLAAGLKTSADYLLGQSDDPDTAIQRYRAPSRTRRSAALSQRLAHPLAALTSAL